MGFLADYLVELVEIEAIMGWGPVQDVCRMHHLPDLIVVHGLSQGASHLLEILECDQAGFVLIEQVKYFA